MRETGTKEVNITYETLFEILRQEKNKEELQKLNEGFFVDVIAYLKGMESSVNNTLQDKDKLREELDNVKRILKDLYERREKKILSLALDVSRTKSNLIDRSGLLNEEKELFDELITLLDNGRDNILNKLLDSSSPGLKAPKAKQNTEPKADVPEEEAKPEETRDKPKEEIRAEAKPEQGSAELKEAPKEEPNNESKEDAGTRMIRFVSAVPKFVGKELEEYGPFEDEDVANLPAKIAKVLIEKGRAEEIKGA